MASHRLRLDSFGVAEYVGFTRRDDGICIIQSFASGSLCSRSSRLSEHGFLATGQFLMDQPDGFGVLLFARS